MSEPGRWRAAGTALGVAAGRFRRRPAAYRDPPHVDERSLAALAEALGAVWPPPPAAGPEPLPIAWLTLHAPPASHPLAAVRAGTPVEPGAEEILDLDGQVDREHPDALWELVTDERLRSRLVVLGNPGAGKSALLTGLVRKLLAERRPDDRVPLLLRLASWRPDRQPLGAWIAERLREDYGHPVAVPIAQLLLILDGLDELPGDQQALALEALDQVLDGAPLVLTSRPASYLEAADALPFGALREAAVVELRLLPSWTVRDYLLRECAPPLGERWAATLDADVADPHGRIAAALTEPLWADLARATYREATDDPAELAALPDETGVRDRLLDRLVPAVYPERPGGTARHSRADAQRWLEWLARDLRRNDRHDLAWWRLTEHLHQGVHVALGFVLAFLLSALVTRVGGPWPELFPTVSAAVLAGTCTALSVAHGGLPLPAWRRFSFWRGLRSRVEHARAVGRQVTRRSRWLPGVVSILAGVATVPVVLRYFLREGASITSAVGAAILFGLIAWVGSALLGNLALALTVGLGTGVFAFFDAPEADASTATDPRGILRHDRTRTLIAVPLTGAALALAWAAVIALFGAVTGGLHNGPIEPVVRFVALGIGLPAGLAIGVLRSAWVRFCLVRLGLAGRRRQPLRLLAFLEDAQRRGVLRQAGGVYQFRHGRLRDRLADRARES